MNKQHIIRVDHILKKSWQVYKNQYKKFLVVPIVMMIILSVVGYLNSHLIINSIEKTGSLLGALTSLSHPTVYVLIISAIITIVVQYIGLISLVILAQRNEGVVSYGNLIRRGFDYFWKYIGYSIIVALINILVIFIVYIPAILIGIIIYFIHNDNFDITFGILGVIPAIAGILYVYYYIFSPYLITEGKGVVESLKLSKGLIRSRWLSILWRIIVIYIITLVIGYVLSLIPYVGVALAVIVFLPLVIIYSFVIYQDIKEGSFNTPTKIKK